MLSLNIGWVLLESMSENYDVIVVECEYGECCCLSWDERDSDCSEVDSYKECYFYKIMVENKAEYDKMGVVERFGFVAKLSESEV